MVQESSTIALSDVLGLACLPDYGCTVSGKYTMLQPVANCVRLLNLHVRQLIPVSDQTSSNASMLLDSWLNVVLYTCEAEAASAAALV